MYPTRRRTIAAAVLGLTVAFTATTPALAEPTYPPADPPLTCKLTAVSSKSKLKINVNPNLKGSRFYSFRIVKKKSLKGGGVALLGMGTYRTAGKSETRTLNFGKGTYLAQCLAKYGHAGANSGSVTLKK